MAFIAAGLGTWVIGLVADSARKTVTTWVVGTPQARALQEAATAAIELTAAELHPGDRERAKALAEVLDHVFSARPSRLPLGGRATLLEALQAGLADQLAVVPDVCFTDAGQSSADLLEVPATLLKQKLTSHLLREIKLRGAQKQALFPLANQLDHEETQQKLQQIEEMLAQVLRQNEHAPARITAAPLASTELSGFGRGLSLEDARFLVERARVLADGGQLALALNENERGIKICQALRVVSPDLHQREIASAMSDRALVLWALDEDRAALEAATDAAHCWSEAAHRDLTCTREFLAAYSQVGELMWELDPSDGAALETAEGVVDSWRDFYHCDPDAYRLGLADSLANLAKLLCDPSVHRTADALAASTEAVDIWRQHDEGNSRNTKPPNPWPLVVFAAVRAASRADLQVGMAVAGEAVEAYGRLAAARPRVYRWHQIAALTIYAETLRSQLAEQVIGMGGDLPRSGDEGWAGLAARWQWLTGVRRGLIRERICEMPW
jgi:hypothetical protein